MYAAAESRSAGSVLSLLAANLITIALALFEGWDLRELMLVYWGQSVIIGYFNYRRILDLDRFSTHGFKMNGVRPPETEKTKRQTATFFAFHYGGFHAAYLFFLLSEGQGFQGSWLMLIVCTLGFYMNHRYSYFHYRERDQGEKPNIGTIMFFPYARVAPMHITIVTGSAIGSTATPGLLLFLVLKTAADLVMHLVEHSSWRK